MKKIVSQLVKDICTRLPVLCNTQGAETIIIFRRGIDDELKDRLLDYLKRVPTDKSIQLHCKRGTLSGNNGVEIPFFPLQLGVFEYADRGYVGLALVGFRDRKIEVALIPVSQWDQLSGLPGIYLTQQQWKLLKKSIPVLISAKIGWKQHPVPYDNHQIQIAAHNAATTLSVDLSPATVMYALESLSVGIFQLMDALLAANLYPEMPRPQQLWVPTVIQISEPELADEVNQLVRAMDLRCTEEFLVRSPAELFVEKKSDLDRWVRQYPSIMVIRYKKSEDVNPLFQLLQQENAALRSGRSDVEDHPYPLILGSSIWSEYSAAEVQFEGGLRREDLRVARWMAAKLVQNRQEFLLSFSTEWDRIIKDPSVWTMNPVQLWFGAFHFAAAQILFVTYSDRLRYLEICQTCDSAKLRIRSSRKVRYEAALTLLTDISGREPWITTRPGSPEEAVQLLYREFDAFRFAPQGTGEILVCFTEDSLVRRCNLHMGEVDDFIAFLREKNVMKSRTHPVTFSGGRQQRFICIRIKEAVSCA